MVNLHTHTARCHHAQGMPMDYAAKAAEKGFSILGFSDHAPLPDGNLAASRMALCDLDSYLQDIRQAQAAFPGLKILCGAECDYMPQYEDYYRRVLLGEKGMDYLIGSIHLYPYRGRLQGFPWGMEQDREALISYAECYTAMLESGLFLFGAHPDAFGAGFPEWDSACAECAETICRAAARTGMPLEINTSGWFKQTQYPDRPRPYPLEPFWEIAARHGVKALVNADAHAPYLVDGYLERGYALAKEYGIALVYPFGR